MVGSNDKYIPILGGFPLSPRVFVCLLFEFNVAFAYIQLENSKFRVLSKSIIEF